MVSNPLPLHEETLLLGGRVRILQPLQGYRAAIDPVLLAAAVPATARRVADMGCGTGAALLGLLARCPSVCGVGVELQPETAALACQSVALNGWSERAEIITGDVRLTLPRVEGNGFEAVMTNPPYHGPGTRSPIASRAVAHMEEVPLEEWLAGCLRCLKPLGHLVVIYRADRLDTLLAALVARKAGSQEVFPLWPRQGEAAKRVIVRAVKGGKGPLTLHPGLILHGADGRFTPQAEALLRAGSPLA